MSVYIYINTDSDGNILEGVGGKGIVVNKSDYQYEFAVEDSSILVEFEKYKVIDGILVRGV